MLLFEAPDRKYSMSLAYHDIVYQVKTGLRVLPIVIIAEQNANSFTIL